MGMENWEAFCRSILGEKYIEPGSRPQSLKRQQRSREPTPRPTGGRQNEPEKEQ